MTTEPTRAEGAADPGVDGLREVLDKAFRTGLREAWDFQRRCAYGSEGPHIQTIQRYVVDAMVSALAADPHRQGVK